MNNILVDFETYYDKELSVSTMGNDNYAAKSDAYLVSVAADDGTRFCGELADLPRHLGTAWMTDPNNQFWAANANFDFTFWKKHFGDHMPAHPWKCVLDAAACNQMPRNLASLSRVALKKEMSKDVRDKMSGIDYWTLSESRQQEVIEYGLTDAVNGLEAIQHVPLSAREDAIAEHTRRVNRQGVAIDLDLAESFKSHLSTALWYIRKRIPWAVAGKPPGSPLEFKKYCMSLGVTPPASMDQRDEAFLKCYAENPCIQPMVDNIQLGRRCAKLIKKIESMEARVRPDGTMPLDLLYCGAPHTRRWSSRGVNIQNLDRDPLVFDPVTWTQRSVSAKQLSGFMAERPDSAGCRNLPYAWLRNLIVPRPGKKLLILDFAQIEPRCLAWLVGDEALLTAVRAGYGVYDAYARGILGWKGEGKLKHVDPVLYQSVKSTQLGSGFGLGWSTLQRTAAAMGNIMTDVEAYRATKKYRADNPKTVGYWAQHDETIRRSAGVTPRTVTLTLPTGEKLRHFNVTPSERAMKVKNPETGEEKTVVKRGYHSFTVRGDRNPMNFISSLWGGVLTENIVQRMARDVLAEALIRLDKAGFTVLFTAHDEIVMEADASDAEEALAEAERIMTIAPMWAHDLPLAVEGGIFERYTKA